MMVVYSFIIYCHIWCMANQRFTLVSAFSNTMLFDYVLGSKISALEKAFDRNLLASFLLANVLTGLVNLSMDTLFASSVSALLILIVFALTLSVVIGLIDFYGVRLKFW
ncbi:hypothetical protein CRYUN_Cryun19dG0158200 [Craigia yunnanensis]